MQFSIIRVFTLVAKAGPPCVGPPKLAVPAAPGGGADVRERKIQRRRFNVPVAKNTEALLGTQ